MTVHRLPAHFTGPSRQKLPLRHWNQVFRLEQWRKRWKQTSILLIFSTRKSFSFFFRCLFFVLPLLLKVALLKVWNSKFKHTKMQKVPIHRNILDNIFIIRPKKAGLEMVFASKLFPVQHFNRRDVICGHRAGKQPYGKSHYILVPKEC